MRHEKNKIVYILGAGASRDFGMPLGDEFFKKGLYLLRLKDEISFDDVPLNHIEDDLNYLRKNLSRIYPNLSDNPEEWPPVEEILTISYELDRDIFDRTKNYVFEMLTTAQRDPFMSIFEYQYKREFTYREKYNKYEKYFENIISNPLIEASFVSFNYDTLLDSILDKSLEKEFPENTPLIYDFTYGYPVFDITNKDKKARENGIMLIKPHGSINLAYCSKCKKVFYSIGNVVYPIKHERELYKCDCGIELQPLVNPPLFGKTHKGDQFMSDYMQEMLKLIETKIACAENIIVVGYSFPDYDMEIKSALLNGLRKNKNPIKWQVIDIGNNIKNKLNNIVPERIEIYCQGFYNYIDEILGADEGRKTKTG